MMAEYGFLVDTKREKYDLVSFHFIQEGPFSQSQVTFLVLLTQFRGAP